MQHKLLGTLSFGIKEDILFRKVKIRLMLCSIALKILHKAITLRVMGSNVEFGPPAIFKSRFSARLGKNRRLG